MCPRVAMPGGNMSESVGDFGDDSHAKALENLSAFGDIQRGGDLPSSGEGHLALRVAWVPAEEPENHLDKRSFIHGVQIDRGSVAGARTLSKAPAERQKGRNRRLDRCLEFARREDVMVKRAAWQVGDVPAGPRYGVLRPLLHRIVPREIKKHETRPENMECNALAGSTSRRNSLRPRRTRSGCGMGRKTFPQEQLAVNSTTVPVIANSKCTRQGFLDGILQKALCEIRYGAPR